MFTKDMFYTLPKYENMKFWFTYNFKTSSWDVIEEEGTIASISARDPLTFTQTSGVIDTDMQILEEFKKFQLRPEYALATFDITEATKYTLEELEDTYEMVFAGAALTRAYYHLPGRNPDNYWPQIENAFNWLRSTDFFIAPASTRFHDSYPGGLCVHSLTVLRRALQLMHSAPFSNSSKLGDVGLCALAHDWCKINLYESYLRNVKNDDTGVWEKVTAYRYTGNSVVNLGHGVSSMFLLAKFFRLNTEEASAIRWHMGAYRVCDSEFSEMQTCNEQFPLVLLLQFADQLSLVQY